MSERTPTSRPDAPDYTPGRGQQLILITGPAIDAEGLADLRAGRTLAAEIDMSAPGDARDALAQLAEDPRFEGRSPFPHLRMIRRAEQLMMSPTEGGRAWEALSDTLHGPSQKVLDALNRASEFEIGTAGATAGAGVTVSVQVSLRLAPMAVRLLLFGVARRRMLKGIAIGGRSGIEMAREAAGRLDDPAPAKAERARRELDALHQNALVADCGEGRVQLLFAGLTEAADRDAEATAPPEADGEAAPVDRATALAASLRTLAAQTPEYSHHRHPAGAGRTTFPAAKRTLKELQLGQSRFVAWEYFAIRPGPAGMVTTVVALALAFVLVVTGAVYFIVDDEEAPACLPFARDEESGECRPTSDGSDCTDEALKPVCEVIAAQNRAVPEDADQFTIALALPMSFDGRDPSAPADIANQMQGAAAAQSLINADQSPKMRIMLADLGPSNTEWEAAADAIGDRRGEENVIAVAGLSSSYEDTRLFIDRMAGEGLVVMGSTITGDNMLNGDPEANSAFRVGPTNAQEAAALASFVAERADLCGVFSVADIDHSYDYATSLYESFQREQDEAGCGDATPRAFTYDGSSISNLDPSSFTQIVEQLCDEIEGDSYVFFAGLARYALPSLIRALSLREEPCLSHGITIVSGDNATSIPNNRAAINDLQAAGVTMYFIGLAHPQQWESASSEYEVSRQLMDSAVDLMGERFGEESRLENGQALMSFEACYVTGVSAQGLGRTVTAAALAEALREYNGRTATGPLRFDELGNPIGKTMTILTATNDLEDPIDVVDLVWG